MHTTQSEVQKSNYWIWAGIPRKKRGEITANSIIRTTSLVTEITEQDIKLKTRRREIVEPRQIAMFLIKKHTKLSLKQIGRHFGGFDHTTVIHSCKTVENLMDTDIDYRIIINTIESKL